MVWETELEGVAEFKAELSDNYVVSTVRDRRGPLGGGLYQLAVEFVSRLSLKEIVTILLEGATYDLLKSGKNRQSRSESSKPRLAATLGGG